MRVVLAPDSFKGSLTAVEVVSELIAGWREVDQQAELLSYPLADGGEGTLAAFQSAVPGSEWNPISVIGPDGRTVPTGWLLLPPTTESPNGTGVVELACTSGIELLEKLAPHTAHTYGFGQAVAAALSRGVSRLILGIGSSASTDGGSGFLRALGARFLDVDGNEVPLGAEGLQALHRVDVSALASPIDTLVITDVTNPLLGDRGAAAVFGPQKGMHRKDVAAVNAALERLATLLTDALTTQRKGRKINPPATITPGTGAAGGTGFGLLAWGAQLVPGAAQIGSLIGFPAAAARADLTVTGEGSYDSQSGAGKAPGYALQTAQSTGIPAALVAGKVAPESTFRDFATVQSLTEIAGSEAAALADPRPALRKAGANLACKFTT